MHNFKKQEESHFTYEEHVNEVEFHQTSQEDVRRKQETDPVWKEVLKWVEKGEGPSFRELRGKEQEMLVACSLFSPELFQILITFWCSRGIQTRTKQNWQDGSVVLQKCSQRLGVSVMKVIVQDTTG